MSAATQSCEERRVEEEARDGTNSPIVVNTDNPKKSVGSPPGSTSNRTEDDLLGDSNDDSSSSMHSTVMDTISDDDLPFDPNLPTGYGETEQATPVKDLVIKDTTPEVDDAKSEKIVPVSSVKESMEGNEASILPATQESVIVEKTSSQR